MLSFHFIFTHDNYIYHHYEFYFNLSSHGFTDVIALLHLVTFSVSLHVLNSLTEVYIQSKATFAYAHKVNKHACGKLLHATPLPHQKKSLHWVSESYLPIATPIVIGRKG